MEGNGPVLPVRIGPFSLDGFNTANSVVQSFERVMAKPGGCHGQARWVPWPSPHNAGAAMLAGQVATTPIR